MEQALHRVLTRVRVASREVFTRPRFTVWLLVMLAVVAAVTQTADGSHLAEAIANTGFAPHDALALDVFRALYSALVTGGGPELLVAAAAIALFVGGLEIRMGGAVAAATFLGVHVATLLAHAGVTAALHASGSALGTVLYHTRDVGPSAGYIGALGALLGLREPARTRRLVALALGAVLAAVLAYAVVTQGAARDISADAAHVLALVLGYAAGRVLARRRARQSAAA